MVIYALCAYSSGCSATSQAGYGPGGRHHLGPGADRACFVVVRAFTNQGLICTRQISPYKANSYAMLVLGLSFLVQLLFSQHFGWLNCRNECVKDTQKEAFIAALCAQISLGIWTLLEYVPPHLGSAHQVIFSKSTRNALEHNAKYAA